MLARALLGAPSLLLLDEADANLDTESRAILDRVIAEFPGTVVMASHRPQMAGRVDAIWRMANGALLAIEPATDAPRAVVALASVAPATRTEPRR
jgi:ABC-type transport system involved in cytochrome bd biosynthesis fused ATPase/permease subunit